MSRLGSKHVFHPRPSWGHFHNSRTPLTALAAMTLKHHGKPKIEDGALYHSSLSNCVSRKWGNPPSSNLSSGSEGYLFEVIMLARSGFLSAAVFGPAPLRLLRLWPPLHTGTLVKSQWWHRCCFPQNPAAWYDIQDMLWLGEGDDTGGRLAR